MTTNTPTTASPLGNAWALHREGRNDQAVSAFEQLVKTNSKDIDAYFGLGLAQRSLGRYDQAQASFERVQELINQQLEVEPGADRWEMLSRMCEQRLEEVNNLRGG